MGSSTSPPQPPIILAGQSPIPTSQVFSQFSCCHTAALLPPPTMPHNPPKLLRPQYIPRISASSFKVYSPCLPAFQHPTQVWPHHLPSPQSRLRETFSCSSLSFALPPLALGLLSPSSSRISQDPTSPSPPPFLSFLRPRPPPDPHTTPSPSTLVRHLLPPHRSPWVSFARHTHARTGFQLSPSSQLRSSPASTTFHPPGPPASCPAPKFRARFPGTKQEKSE